MTSFGAYPSGDQVNLGAALTLHAEMRTDLGGSNRGKQGILHQPRNVTREARIPKLQRILSSSPGAGLAYHTTIVAA